MVIQAKLSADQIEAFYHDQFVDDQVKDYQQLMTRANAPKTVVDVGGGCGFFAKKLANVTGERTRVVDMDPTSVEFCKNLGVAAQVGDALTPPVAGDEDVIAFNLILHHLVGRSEADTRRLQIKALKEWHGKAKYIFVNEYIYQSFVSNISGRVIFEITSSKFLSFIGRQISRTIPSFRANTFGVGVRFRAHGEWCSLFNEAGYSVVNKKIGSPEYISLPLRSLLIKAIRRDSFVLAPN